MPCIGPLSLFTVREETQGMATESKRKLTIATRTGSGRSVGLGTLKTLMGGPHHRQLEN